MLLGPAGAAAPPLPSRLAGKFLQGRGQLLPPSQAGVPGRRRLSRCMAAADTPRAGSYAVYSQGTEARHRCSRRKSFPIGGATRRGRVGQAVEDEVVAGCINRKLQTPPKIQHINRYVQNTKLNRD